MLTFFNILIVLVVVNVLLLVFSVNRSSNKAKKTTTKIFPMNTIQHKYKKAV